MPDQPKQDDFLAVREALLGVLIAIAAAAALIAALTFLASVATDAKASGGGVGTGGGGHDSGGQNGGHGYIFPLPAHHSYGDGFGAGRGHQGQDVFASCGKKLIAVRDGRVQQVAYQSAAGNYIVLDSKGTGVDVAYMHLKKKAIPHEGDKVRQGETIGFVGQTGDATGCHLHFERWTAPGYYEGGHASSRVTKVLKKWDKYS